MTRTIEARFIAKVAEVAQGYLDESLTEKEAKYELSGAMEEWGQVASGETLWGDDIHGRESFVRGGDFDRLVKEHLSKDEDSNVDMALNRLFEVYDHSFSSVCEGCACIMATDYDDQFLITDGSIYCHKCCGEPLDEALCDVNKKAEKAEDLGPDNKRNFFRLLADWSIHLSPSTILKSLEDQGWSIEGDEERLTMLDSRNLLDRLYEEGIPHFTIALKGFYPTKLAVAYKEEA